MSDHAISLEDKKSMSRFCLEANRFTSSKEVKRFEKKWAEWQGCKYAVFVNSGSSANLLAVNAMKLMHGNGLCICQASTWSTNVSPVCQMGMQLQLCDVSLDNFGPDLSNLEHLFSNMSPKYMFLTHLIGFAAVTDELLELCKRYNVILLEDCCESHGAVFSGTKVGNFGEVSTFSFYYGHHITTIEGGMVCTNDEDVYCNLLLLRSHGLLRELPKNKQETIEGLDPLFTFMTTGYNFRGDEIRAMLGCRQVDRLDDIIKKRNHNLKIMLSNLDSNLYKTNFNTNGVSSFCLPIYSRVPIHKVKDMLTKMNIEYRPCIGGNLFRHPILNSVNQFRYDSNAEELHKNCIYVGNHQDVHENQIIDLCKSLNSIV